MAAEQGSLYSDKDRAVALYSFVVIDMPIAVVYIFTKAKKEVSAV